MTRRKLIAGNWKMNKTIGEAVSTVVELRRVLPACGCEVAVAPPATALHAVAEATRGSEIKVAAQDLFWEEQGAYTGALSGGVSPQERGHQRIFTQLVAPTGSTYSRT